jgi:hypothetical protein
MKKIVALTLICVLVLPLMSACAVFTAPKTIRCDQLIVFDRKNSDHWIGTLSGCAIAGKVEYWETPQNYVTGAKGEKVEHYFETFTITTATGVIEGVDKGIYNLSSNFKFNADGSVTSATGAWTYLVGYKFHEIGWTTDPNINPISGPSTMFLAP